MGWMSRFTTRDRQEQAVEVEVCGNTMRFYPNRLRYVTAALRMAAPFVGTISALFADDSRDSGSKVVEHSGEEDGSPFFHKEITSEPIPVQMAQHRAGVRERAIQELLMQFDEAAMIDLGRFWMDSLREEFDFCKEERPKEQVERFLYGDPESDYTGIDMPIMVQLFAGWMKANAKAFSILGEGLFGAVTSRVKQAVMHRLPSEDPAASSSSKTLSEDSSAP